MSLCIALSYNNTDIMSETITPTSVASIRVSLYVYLVVLSLSDFDLIYLRVTTPFELKVALASKLFVIGPGPYLYEILLKSPFLNEILLTRPIIIFNF